MLHAQHIASKLSELEDKGKFSLLVLFRWPQIFQGRKSNIKNAIAARRKTLLEVSDICHSVLIPCILAPRQTQASSRRFKAG